MYMYFNFYNSGVLMEYISLRSICFFSFLSVESPFHVMTITKNTLALRPPEAKGYSSLVEGKNYKLKNVKFNSSAC